MLNQVCVRQDIMALDTLRYFVIYYYIVAERFMDYGVENLTLNTKKKFYLTLNQ